MGPPEAWAETGMLLLPQHSLGVADHKTSSDLGGKKISPPNEMSFKAILQKQKRMCDYFCNLPHQSTR